MGAASELGAATAASMTRRCRSLLDTVLMKAGRRASPRWAGATDTMRRHLTEVGDLRGTPVSGVGGRQFWVGLEPSAVPAALTALAADYTVAMDPPVATRRMWLDSIDLRLYRSGMALTPVESPDGGGCMLELSR